MSLVILENCSYKKSVLLFLSTGATRTQDFFCQSKQQMVFNAIRFLLSCLIANMATIIINFKQKFAFVRSFQHFANKFLNQKRFLARLKKSVSKSLLSWRGKCEVSELQMHVQK